MPSEDDAAAPTGDSIGDAVRAAFDTAEKAPATDDTAGQSGAGKAVDQASGRAGTEASGDAPVGEANEGRARGPDGKFLPKPDAAVVASPADGKVADPKAAVVADPAAAKPDAPKSAEPPPNWTAADKAIFAAMPAEAQALVARREAERDADYTRKTQAIAALRRDFEPVAEMFRPYEAQMRAAGMPPAKAIEGWMHAERALMEGRGAALVADVVRTYKIDPQAIAQALGLTPAQGAPGPGGAPPAPQPPNGQPIVLPPEVTARLSAVDQFLAEQQRRDQQRVAEQRQAVEARVVSTIDQFAAAKGADGKPTHPLFAEVEDHMAQLLLASQQAGRPQPSLDDLYDQAVWANPSTRAKQLEATRAADEAQRTAQVAAAATEARAKAEKARRAGSSVTGSPGSGQTPRTPPRGSGSLRDDILAADEEISAVA